MAATQVRTDGTSTDTLNYASRQTVVLSDGTRLVAVFGNSTKKWYIYYTTDGVTYTLKITSPLCSSSVFSMGVEDTGDHIQFLYQTDITSLSWARYTKSGTTWTLDTSGVLDSSTQMGKADIACLPGAGACVVAFHKHDNLGSYTALKARGTGGSWGTTINGTIDASHGGLYDPVFASYNPSASPGNVLVGGVTFNSRVDVQTATVNASTGAITGVTAISNPAFSDLLTTPSGYGQSVPQHSTLTSIRDTSSGAFYLVLCAPYSTTQTIIKLFKISYNGTVWTANTPFSTIQSHRQVSSTFGPAAVILNTGKLVVFVNNTDGMSVDSMLMDIVTGTVINAFGFTTQPSTSNTLNSVGAGAQKFVQGVADVVLNNGLDGLYFADYNHTPTPPTAITPASGATVTSDAPTLSATLPDLQMPGAFKRKAQWQLATNSLFTTGVVNVVEADADSDAVTVHYETPGTIISEGTWWIRGATIDAFGTVSAWGAGQSFTDSHSPLAINLSPNGGVSLPYGTTGHVTFDWDFTDPFPGDTQSAYQIVIEVNSSGAAVLDTGKVTSTVTNATLTIPSGSKEVVLRWKIRLWNQGNVVGAYSAYNTFLIGDVPVVAITAPTAGQVLANGDPATTWTFTGAAGQTQATYRVVYTQTTAPTRIVHDSGVIAGAATTYTPGDILDNAMSYTVTVYVTDTVGLAGQASHNFTTLWTPPAAITSQSVDPTSYNTLGYVSVAWANTEQDASWVSYRVYRQPVGASEWNLVHETADVLSTYQFRDWLVAGEQDQQYAVVQTVAKFSHQLESNKVATSSINVSNADYYLVDPDDDTKNILLSIVTADSFTEEYESADLQLIGRGRKRDYGTRWGYNGSLTAQVWDDELHSRTARDARLALEAMKAEMKSVYLRTPFGDVWQVALGDAQIGRLAGVGVREFHTLTLPYTEVSS